MVFGMCRNEYGDFPEEGYADQVGSVRTKGHFYRCAASAAWVEPQKLFMKIQIIDKYFGNLNVTFGFAEDRLCLLYTSPSPRDTRRYRMPYSA